MSIRKIILTTTILSLPLAGGAWAQSNEAILEQDGDYNDALSDQSAGANGQVNLIQEGSYNNADITQVGSSNIAGTVNPFQTGYGSWTEWIEQNGDNNSVVVDQEGSHNVVADARVGADEGVLQSSDWNMLSISQTSSSDAYNDGNFVGVVRQSGVSGATSTTNEAMITQTNGDPALRAFHTVRGIYQTNTGGAKNTLSIDQNGGSGPGTGQREGNYIQLITQNGADNEITIDQNGGTAVGVSFGDGPLNTIQTVTQSGDGHQITLNQDGQSNYVDIMTQSGGAGNSATVSLTGNGNGSDGIATNNGTRALGSLIGFAATTGARASSVEQIGDDNEVNYLAQGNSNQFGFYQSGDLNSVGNVTILGNGNNTAAWQDGDNNSLTLAPISGNDNNVGVSQLGDRNIADIALTIGSDRNDVGILQDGDDNNIDLGIAGDDNYVDLTQFGSNEATLSIAGDSNGDGLSGFADDAAQIGLASGKIVQNNSLGGLANIFTASIEGDSNLFAASQIGGGNEIDLTVDGSSNQFAAMQTGSSNVSNVTQIGNNNNVGILQ